MKTAQILSLARQFIVSGWCQKNQAVNSRDVRVCYASSEACKFCPIGAIARAVFDLGLKESEYQYALVYLRKVLGVPTITSWNDDQDRTQAEVLSGFEKAIAKLEDLK